MDAYLYPLVFFVAAVLGWLAGRATRQFGYDVEAYNRAFGTYGDSFTDSGTNSDRDGDVNGAGFYLAQYRDARSRTILRDHVGDSPAAGVRGGDSDFEHEAPLK